MGRADRTLCIRIVSIATQPLKGPSGGRAFLPDPCKPGGVTHRVRQECLTYRDLGTRKTQAQQ